MGIEPTRQLVTGTLVLKFYILAGIPNNINTI